MQKHFLKKLGKKGQTNMSGPIWGMVAAVAAFIILVFFQAIGANILDKQRAAYTAGSLPDNITVLGMNGIKAFADQNTTIANVMVGVLILVLLFGAFAVFTYFKGSR